MWWFRLASHLGIPVGELQERMGADEFMEWIAYNRIEPWTSQREFLGHAIVASTIANVHRGKGKRPYQASDFMPRFEKKKSRSISDQRRLVMAFCLASGGKVTSG